MIIIISIDVKGENIVKNIFSKTISKKKFYSSIVVL